MDISAIIYPVVSIGGMGLLFGIILGVAAKKFAVPVDDTVENVKEYLPGANCGGCGFPGCDAMAKSIASGESGVNACPVCSTEQVAAIAKIMGLEATSEEKKVAVLRCKGDISHSKAKYEYKGIQSCTDANLVGGGPKVCTYGCLGFGTCQTACQFGAITLVQGLPVINPDKCTACGGCKRACPRNIIHILPISTSYHVNCISKDKGKVVKEGCTVGCIGCGICAKQCEVEAIQLKDNLAEIDSQKCIQCGKCEAKCPTKAISNLRDRNKEEGLRHKTALNHEETLQL